MQPVTEISRQALVEAFAERARAVSALVSTVENVQEAARIIATSEVPSTTGRYTATTQTLATYPELRSALQAHGVDLRVAEDLEADSQVPADTAVALAGDIGIVLGQAGVAETGSFLSVEETLPSRLLGMLADTVYAILPAANIVPTMDEIGRRLEQLSRQGTRYVSLITGPSRTADIERVLTIGVQGPKVLHVLVVDEGRKAEDE